MTSLIACLSTGKGTWGPVVKLMNSQECDNIFLITNNFSQEKFTTEKKVTFVLINSNDSVKVMRDFIINALSNKILDTEVALNLTSGSGNEHLATLSAIIKLGLGIRLVIASDSGVEEI